MFQRISLWLIFEKTVLPAIDCETMDSGKLYAVRLRFVCSFESNGASSMRALVQMEKDR